VIEKIQKSISQSISVKEMILHDTSMLQTLEAICREAIEGYNNGKKILIAGNGGSAADAQHIAAELVARFYFDRAALAAIALTTDSSILTAVGNDYGFESLFSRQIEAHAHAGDIFIALSTSGNSPNILQAIQSAKQRGVKIVGFTGTKESKMDTLCDYIIKVPSTDTPRIQEAHIMIGHIFCQMVEEQIFS
jgi:D-sedoheptulose 7-phosphate isomerase